jgi:hypothetical protein
MGLGKGARRLRGKKTMGAELAAKGGQERQAEEALNQPCFLNLLDKLRPALRAGFLHRTASATDS